MLICAAIDILITQAIRDFQVEGLTAATFTPFDEEGYALAVCISVTLCFLCTLYATFLSVSSGHVINV